MSAAAPLADSESAALRRRLIQWLRDQEGGAGSTLRRAGMLGAFAGALVIPQAWFLAYGIALVVVGGATLAEALPWLLPVPPIMLVRFGITQWADRMALGGAIAVKGHVRAALVRKLQALGTDYVQARSSGALATVVIDGVEALQPYYARYRPNLAVLYVVPLAIAAVVLPRDWISGLVLLVTAPVIPLFMFLIGHGTERLNQRQWRKLAQLSGRLLDALRHLTTIKLFNAAGREADSLARVSDEYRRTTMSVLRVAFLSSLALEFFATVGIALVAVLIGFRLLDGMMGFGVGLFALLLAPEFYAPLRRLGADYHARMEALAAAEGVVAVLEASEPRRGTGEPSLPEKIAISFEDVAFAYGETPALQGATLALEPGTVTALVGASGSGKSTLLSLLATQRVPHGGRVVVAGHDLASISPSHWLQQVALVPQRPYLFAGSIRDNIRLGQPDAPQSAVEAVATSAAIHDFIMSLPDGYATPVGEHGHTLSGGQAQRLALARAFLKPAPVVLMDEGTAGLDHALEDDVGAALARLARGRTVLVIAHRLRTVQLADRIAVMEGGRIVEAGSPSELGAADTRFARMLRADEEAAWAAT
ncbi:thiol reductant ABC exporter subunit CydD [Variovorax sp. J22P168]|uniref:thiol reductant ABC exporter subunit CydD n=1 Tax=Variovorax jilinensis TaxID=3053513 RepID=UPI002578F3D2|nr:thiol reductant ABC exporter subunit CydD [Variovorax sp. J22P168]MDM0014629.1 thiol reductant ABC exporter subunit CydD [Variovorax sp. J22P168]